MEALNASQSDAFNRAKVRVLSCSFGTKSRLQSLVSMIKILMIKGGGKIFSSMTLAAFLVGCEKPGTFEPGKHDASIDGSSAIIFPIRRRLTNRDGRSIETDIVGRENDRIYFVRLSDGFESSSTIENLSFQDQAFAFQLPVIPPPEGFGDSSPRNRSVRANETQETDLNSIAIQNHQRALTTLNERNAELETRLENASNQIEQRSLMSEIKRNQSEISRIGNEISLLQSRSNP